MIEIPPRRLASEILEAVIKEYVLREGTDYGETEVPLQTKIGQVKGQLADGSVVLVFDPESETCNILTREDYRRIRAEQDG